MRTLSLDLGTTTGWAIRENGRLRAGSWVLATEKELRAQRAERFDRRLDRRVTALWKHLWEIGAPWHFDWLVFEDVLFSTSRAQSHLWASFRTTAWIYAHHNDIKVECLDTAKLKLFATGFGAADKEMMAAHLCKKVPGEVRFYDNAVRLVDTNEIIDDNGIDAAHLLLWAESILKNEPNQISRPR